MPGSYLKDELYELVKKDSSIFEFLQEGSFDGVWYWNIEDPLHEWLSPAFKELFGHQDDEIPNTSVWWQENIHPDDLKVVLKNFNEHLNNPDHLYDQIVRYFHKDGHVVWVRCRGMTIRDEDGKPIRMLGVHIDVTEMKETQIRLEKQCEVLTEQVKRLEALIYTKDVSETVRTLKSVASELRVAIGS